MQMQRFPKSHQSYKDMRSQISHTCKWAAQCASSKVQDHPFVKEGCVYKPKWHSDYKKKLGSYLSDFFDRRKATLHTSKIFGGINLGNSEIIVKEWSSSCQSKSGVIFLQDTIDLLLLDVTPIICETIIIFAIMRDNQLPSAQIIWVCRIQQKCI